MSGWRFPFLFRHLGPPHVRSALQWWTIPPLLTLDQGCVRQLPMTKRFALSLKILMPSLADHLGTTAAALYERQRALVQGGLLTSKHGRGPGSGVPANPKNAALLVIAMLATQNLA